MSRSPLVVSLSLAAPAIDGRYVRLEPLSAAKHGDGLYEASSVSDVAGRFAWLPDYPPETRPAFQPWLDKVEASEDPDVPKLLGDALYLEWLDQAASCPRRHRARRAAAARRT